MCPLTLRVAYKSTCFHIIKFDSRGIETLRQTDMFASRSHWSVSLVTPHVAPELDPASVYDQTPVTVNSYPIPFFVLVSATSPWSSR